jgi:hypothetical protein
MDYVFAKFAELLQIGKRMHADEPSLRRFLGCQRSHGHPLRSAADNLHLLPVVGHLSAAVEAHYVRSRGEGSAAARAFLDGYGKADIAMRATEQHIQDPGEHPSTSTESRCGTGGTLSGFYLR